MTVIGLRKSAVVTVIWAIGMPVSPWHRPQALTTYYSYPDLLSKKLKRRLLTALPFFITVIQTLFWSGTKYCTSSEKKFPARSFETRSMPISASVNWEVRDCAIIIRRGGGGWKTRGGDFIYVINSISAIFSSSSSSLSRPDFRERTAGWQWDVDRLPAETLLKEEHKVWRLVCYTDVKSRKAPPHCGEERCMTTLKTAVRGCVADYVKMCLEIFGSLEIALHRIETFRYEAENDCEDDIWLKVFSRIHKKKRQPQAFILLFFFHQKR